MASKGKTYLLLAALLLVLLFCICFLPKLIPSLSAPSLWVGLGVGLVLGGCGTLLVLGRKGRPSAHQAAQGMELPSDDDHRLADRGVSFFEHKAAAPQPAQGSPAPPWREGDVKPGRVFTYPGRVAAPAPRAVESPLAFPVPVVDAPSPAPIRTESPEACLSESLPADPLTRIGREDVHGRSGDDAQTVLDAAAAYQPLPISQDEDAAPDPAAEGTFDPAASTQMAACTTPEGETPPVAAPQEASSPIPDAAPLPWWRTRSEAVHWPLGRTVVEDVADDHGPDSADAHPEDEAVIPSNSTPGDNASSPSEVPIPTETYTTYTKEASATEMPESAGAGVSPDDAPAPTETYIKEASPTEMPESAGESTPSDAAPALSASPADEASPAAVNDPSPVMDADVPRLPVDDPMDESRPYRSLLEEFAALRRQREELPPMDFPWAVDRSIPSRPMLPPPSIGNIFDAAAWEKPKQDDNEEA